MVEIIITLLRIFSMLTIWKMYEKKNNLTCKPMTPLCITLDETSITH